MHYWRHLILAIVFGCGVLLYKQRMLEEVVLVTGGGGYVGSHCILSMLESGYKVLVIDNLVNCYKSNNKNKPESLIRVEELTGKDIDFINADLLNPNSLEDIFKNHKISCVIHFAALKAVGESCEIPLTYYKNNVAGSVNLFQLMDKYKVRKLVYSSSSTVYGSPQFLPLTEDHPTGQNIANPYGRTKYFTEEILKDICAANKDWHAISLRYFNPVGAHQSGRIGEDPTGIPNNLMPFIAQVAVGTRKQVQVFGNDYATIDGTGVRDYIHIMDLASGHVKALDRLLPSKSRDGQSFSGFEAINLGTGSGYSVLQVIEEFQKACACSIPYKIASRRVGDIAESYCNASLAERKLNWTAKYNLRDMCADMWKWQSQNPNGYATR